MKATIPRECQRQAPTLRYSCLVACAFLVSFHANDTCNGTSHQTGEFWEYNNNYLAIFSVWPSVNGIFSKYVSERSETILGRSVLSSVCRTGVSTLFAVIMSRTWTFSLSGFRMNHLIPVAVSNTAGRFLIARICCVLNPIAYSDLCNHLWNTNTLSCTPYT